MVPLRLFATNFRLWFAITRHYSNYLQVSIMLELHTMLPFTIIPISKDLDRKPPDRASSCELNTVRKTNWAGGRGGGWFGYTGKELSKRAMGAF